MKKSPFLIIVAGVLIFTACKGPADKNNTVADSTAKPDLTKTVASADTNVIVTKEYQVTKPDGWHKTEKMLNNFEMLFLSAPKEADFQSNINVLRDDMKGRDMKDYIDFNLNQMRSMNVKDLKSDDLTVGDIQGKQLTYTYEYQGKNVAIKSYILPKNGVAYVLTATTLVSTKDKFVPEFDKIVQSFKVL